MNFIEGNKPLMLAGGVVDHQIQDQLHIPFMTQFNKFL